MHAASKSAAGMSNPQSHGSHQAIGQAAVPLLKGCALEGREGGMRRAKMGPLRQTEKETAGSGLDDLRFDVPNGVKSFKVVVHEQAADHGNGCAGCFYRKNPGAPVVNPQTAHEGHQPNVSEAGPAQRRNPAFEEAAQNDNPQTAQHMGVGDGERKRQRQPMSAKARRNINPQGHKARQLDGNVSMMFQTVHSSYHNSSPLCLINDLFF